MFLRALFALLLAAPLAARPACAAETVDLRLVLAIDCSGSVSEGRFLLQRHGYAVAFRSPKVLQAIQAAGPRGAIAVTMFQWTGPLLHQTVVPWTVVRDAASAKAVADTIEAGPRQLFGGGTSISGAIDHAMALLQSSPYLSPRRTIDVSGDGSNNRGRPAQVARDEAVKSGAVINGLPILTVEPDLDGYYKTHVIGGPGSFMVVVHSADDFAQAVERKLIQEIAAARAPRRLAGR